MALTLVVTGNTVNAADVNQMVSVLQQPSGGTETGSYVLSQACHASGGFVTLWVWSLSRVSTPVSASLTTAIQSPTNINSPAASHLRVDGFQVNATSTGATSNATVGGATTIQF